MLFDIFITKVAFIEWPPDIQAQNNFAHPLTTGFQNLNLPESDAARILEMIMRGGGSGYVLATSYRNPPIPLDKAQAFATEEAKKIISENFPGTSFEPLRFAREEAKYWVFSQGSQELEQQGIVPGVLEIFIDKNSGHAATQAERVQQYFEEYYVESATAFNAEELIQKWQRDFGMNFDQDYFDNNRTSLRKNALFSIVTAHFFPGLIEKRYGFKPKLHVRFRLMPHLEKEEITKKTMFAIIQNLMSIDDADLIVTTDRWQLITVLKRINNITVVNSSAEDWTLSLLTSRAGEYEFRELPVV